MWSRVKKKRKHTHRRVVARLERVDCHRRVDHGGALREEQYRRGERRRVCHVQAALSLFPTPPFPISDAALSLSRRRPFPFPTPPLPFSDAALALFRRRPCPFPTPPFPFSDAALSLFRRRPFPFPTHVHRRHLKMPVLHLDVDIISVVNLHQPLQGGTWCGRMRRCCTAVE